MRPMAHARKTGETSGRKTTEVSALQSSNAHLPKSVTVRGRLMEMRLSHFQNARSLIRVRLSGNVREVIPLQLSKAYSSMLVSVLGKLTSFRKLQRSNVRKAIVLTESGSVMEVSPLQAKKA